MGAPKNKPKDPQAQDRALAALLEEGAVPSPVPTKTIQGVLKKIGRPYKYAPELDDQVRELMAQGLSRENVWTILGISNVTAYTWINPEHKQYHPSFAQAVRDGEALSLLWWMETGRRNIYNKDFNSTLYMMQMQNRHGWSRKLEGRLEANISASLTRTEKHEVKIESDEQFGEILRILLDAGAIPAGAQGAAHAQDDGVLPVRPNA